MKTERFLEIDGTKVFEEDIKKMSFKEIKALCSFLDNERDLQFVRNLCHPNLKHIIDNIIYKL
jgi:CRISPR/Cas system CSM-associated protein Csm4 (group 5 of RAMP superfamily)